MRGLFFLKIEEYEKALEDFSKSHDAVNHDASKHFQPMTYQYHAYPYFLKKEYKKALYCLSKAIELDSQNASFYHFRGNCYLEIKEYDKAESDFDKAISLSPYHVDIYSKIITSYYNKNIYDKALIVCDKLSEIYPDNIDSRIYRAVILCKNGYEKESLEELSLFRKEFEGLLVYIISPNDSQYGSLLGGLANTSSINYMLKSMEILLDLKELEFYNDKYIEAADILDSYEIKKDNLSKKIQLFLNNIFRNYYPKFNNSLSEILERDGENIFLICAKLSILEDIQNNFSKEVSDLSGEERKELLEEKFNQQTSFMFLYSSINRSLQEKYIELVEKKEQEKAQARVDERNKIIADLSHSIKNLISTVIDPLETLKQEKEENIPVIQNAIKGANLIREIVNAMNLSFNGSIDDFYYDAGHNTGKDAISLQYIIVQSLKYSIGHMFDAKYFENFLRKYFPGREIFKEAKDEWTQKSQTNNIEELLPFIQKYFFDINLDIPNAADFVIGNEKGSAIKFLILLQELIFNAVKYSAFMKKDIRFLNITLAGNDEQIIIKVENRYKKAVKTKTSGIGLVIIKNFAKLLETEPVIIKGHDIYSVEIKFLNFWKEKN